MSSKLAINFLKNIEKGKKRTKEEHDYRDGARYVEYLAEEIGSLPDMKKIQEEDEELYEYIRKGPFLVNHFQLNKENYGTEIWRKNVEFIKKFNRDLKRGYKF